MKMSEFLIMEVIIPATMTVTIGAIAAFLSLFAGIIGIYHRLSNQITKVDVKVDTVNAKVDTMTVRNIHADQETAAVKGKQAEQDTAIAVMSVQIANMVKITDKIDRNIEKLVEGNGK
jgi:hypothetical protein